MIRAITPVICLAVGVAMWHVFTDEAAPEPVTIRDPTQGECEEWGLRIIDAAAAVARRKHTREYDRRLWAVNHAHAVAFNSWRNCPINRMAV